MTSRSALFALHAAVALFGFAALFGRWIALPAAVIVLGRTSIAALALALVLAARRERLTRPAMPLVVNGAILALHWVTFFAAVQLATVAVALLGYASFPLFVLLLERRLGVDRAHAAEWMTALLAMLGLVVLATDFDVAAKALQGLGLGIVSGFTFALLAVRNRGLVERLPATQLALWQNAFAALCLVPLVLLLGSAAPRGPDIVLLIVLGVVSTGAAHTLFIASMRRVSAHTASIVAALEPVYGIALAALLLDEIPNARTLAGGAMIIAAALVASRQAR